MSMHSIPLTPLERDGLEKHGLDIGTPSQLSDVFRHGVKHALSTIVQPVTIDVAVSRFLSWQLPVNFAPDCYVSFKHPGGNASWPTGTNLLSADQAHQMLTHVVGPDNVPYKIMRFEREHVYYVGKKGLFWHVCVGTDERTIYRSFFKRRAGDVAERLNAAFLKGLCIGRKQSEAPNE